MSVWRNVQVERPSSSTSGGQEEEEEEGFGGLMVVGEVVDEVFVVVDFIMLFHAAPEVQVRHLFFLFHQPFSFIYLHSFKHDIYMICLFGEWIFFFLSDLRFSIGSDYYAFGHSLRFICIFGANALLGAGVQWLRRKSGHGFYCTKEILQNGKVDVSIRHIMMLLLLLLLLSA